MERMGRRTTRLAARLPRISGALAALVLGWAACGGNSEGNPSAPRGNVRGDAALLGAGPGDVLITASGETLALSGFSFPPSRPDQPYFVDGWEVRFERLLATFDRIEVVAEPDLDPNDQQRTGAVVAEARGPWAVDLHQGGPLPGKGGVGQAVALTVIRNQTNNGGKPFDADAKLGVNFAVVAASADAKRINLPQDDRDYAEMIEKGYSVLYVGTAEFKGTDCRPTDTSPLASLPKKVPFRWGFTTKPSLVNCQNPDLGTLPGGEESPRGLFIKTNGPALAQLTLHVDHPFWSANEEDAPLRFDAFALAAQVKNVTRERPLTLEDLESLTVAPIGDGRTTLPERFCAPATGTPASELVYDTKGSREPHLRAFVEARQVSQGHLNADGLCALRTP